MVGFIFGSRVRPSAYPSLCESTSMATFYGLGGGRSIGVGQVALALGDVAPILVQVS